MKANIFGMACPIPPRAEPAMVDSFCVGTTRYGRAVRWRLRI